MNATAAFSPLLDRNGARLRLRRLLRTGPIVDADLEGRARRLGEAFQAFASLHHPLPLPDHIPDSELARLTDIHLPGAEVAAAFRRLARLSCQFDSHDVFAAHLSWPALLALFPPLIRTADPARWLRLVAADDAAREVLLFAVALPDRHGESFGRYPLQLDFIRSLTRGRRSCSCLDAACGSGEGTWDLALLLHREGICGDRLAVKGTTLQPLEVFAAAHAWFPHDRRREALYRSRLAGIPPEVQRRVVFAAEDLAQGVVGELHDLVVCNGLLGGPALHREPELRRVVETLAARVKKRGFLLAADRFHAGWKHRERIVSLLEGTGLVMLPCPDGMAAQRK